MKILFISDIHGNYPALEVLRDYIENADMTICLGDIVGYHCYVNEVIDFLIKHDVICIQGNHDRYVFEGVENQQKEINDSVKFGIEIAQKELSEDNKDWLSKLPTSFSFKVDNTSFLCCHGSPWDVTNGYVYENSSLFPKMQDFAFDVIALGHTHREYTKNLDGLIVFNPGSVGQARDIEGMACAKVFNTETQGVKTIRERYDYMSTINNSIAHGAQEWIYKHFRTLKTIKNDTF